MPLTFDVVGVGAGSTNVAVAARIPLNQNYVITAVQAVAQTGAAEINIVYGEAAESGVVTASGVFASPGNMAFVLDAGQNVANPGQVYTFAVPTAAIYGSGGELTLRVITAGAGPGVGGLKVVVYTTADAPAATVTPSNETSFNPALYAGSSFYPFGFPNSPLGLWVNFDPTQGQYNFTLSPGFQIGSIWFPNISTPIELFAPNSTVPFYETGSGGSECVPCPSGLTGVSFLSPSGVGALIPVFISSYHYDPSKSTTSGPNVVASVTGIAPITITGPSTNPVVGITNPLPLADGGTGTATPSLVQGQGIIIAGTWPDQTISVASPLAVGYGGSGSTNPSLIAGNPGIAIAGSWPNQTILNEGVALYNSNGTLQPVGIMVAYTGVTNSSGTYVLNLGALFPNGVRGATASSTNGATPYIINVSISGSIVTFTSYASGGASAGSIGFSAIIVGN